MSFIFPEAMAKGVIEKIKCDKCGYENEPQRIFCHECGAKLDRSEYVHEVEEARQRDAKTAPRRLDDLRKKIPMITAKGALILLLCPPILAVLLLMIQRMDEPYINTEGPAMDASMQLAVDFPGALGEGSPRTVTAAQDVASLYVNRRLKTPEKGSYWEKTLRGGWVVMKPDEIIVISNRDLANMGYNFTVGVSYSPVDMGEQGTSVAVKNLYLGRLRLPPALSSLLAPKLMADVADKLKVEPEDVGRVESLVIQEGVTTLQVKPMTGG